MKLSSLLGILIATTLFSTIALAGSDKEDAIAAATIAKQILGIGALEGIDPRADRTACTFIGVAYYASQGNSALDPAYDFCNFLTGPEPTRAQAIASLEAYLKKPAKPSSVGPSSRNDSPIKTFSKKASY